MLQGVHANWVLSKVFMNFINTEKVATLAYRWRSTVTFFFTLWSKHLVGLFVSCLFQKNLIWCYRGEQGVVMVESWLIGCHWHPVSASFNHRHFLTVFSVKVLAGIAWTCECCLVIFCNCILVFCYHAREIMWVGL